ncbi:MAG: NifB/NifX family molybdenum-iron cluster-binding protein [Pseudomonadota bacterium]
MRLAIPSEIPGGLESAFCPHFGHAPAYTLVELDGTEFNELQVVANAGHEPGGCMGPVGMLKQAGVEALVAGGMGARPLAGLQDNGITVYFGGQAATVRQAAQMVATGQAPQFSPAQVCGGGHSDCGQH